jgi:amidase
MDELIFSSATHLAEAIRDKKVSSAEVVDACVRRIEEVNPKLNAETARSQAREADESLARGEIKGPLHGVPMTTKDALDIRGVVTTGAPWAGHPA